MNSEFFKNAMTSGLIIGGLVIIYYVFLYSLGINIYEPQDQSNYFGKIDYIIIAMGVFFAIKRYRNRELEGLITYKESLFFGTVTGFFASLAITLYVVAFFKFISPETFQEMYKMAEQQLLNQSISQAEKDTLMSMTTKLIFPVIIIATIFGNTFIAFLYSTFVSFFMRKK